MALTSRLRLIVKVRNTRSASDVGELRALRARTGGSEAEVVGVSSGGPTLTAVGSGLVTEMALDTGGGGGGDGCSCVGSSGIWVSGGRELNDEDETNESTRWTGQMTVTPFSSPCLFWTFIQPMMYVGPGDAEEPAISLE